jgi:hypothetical protein
VKALAATLASLVSFLARNRRKPSVAQPHSGPGPARSACRSLPVTTALGVGTSVSRCS